MRIPIIAYAAINKTRTKKKNHTQTVVGRHAACVRIRAANHQIFAPGTLTSPVLAWCSHRTLPDTSISVAPSPVIQTPEKLNTPPQSISVHVPTNIVSLSQVYENIVELLTKTKKQKKTIATVGWTDHPGTSRRLCTTLPFKVGRGQRQHRVSKEPRAARRKKIQRNIALLPRAQGQG